MLLQLVAVVLSVLGVKPPLQPAVRRPDVLRQVELTVATEVAMRTEDDVVQDVGGDGHGLTWREERRKRSRIGS